MAIALGNTNISKVLKYTLMSSSSEAFTRTELIDPALELAGWNLKDPNQVGFEIPVDGYDAEPDKKFPSY